MTELIADIGKIIVFLLLLLAIFLYTVKFTKRVTNFLFASFLVVTATDMSAFFLNEFYAQHPIINTLKASSILLQMPFYYLFVKASCFTNFRLQSKDLIHALPFTAFLALALLLGLNDTTYFWCDMATQSQFYLYIIAVFITLKRYKTLERNNYSFKNEVYLLLMVTSILFLISNVLLLLRYFFEVYIHNGILMSFRLINLLFALLIICWFVLKTMRTPALFSGINSNIETGRKKLVSNPSEHKTDTDELQRFMTTEKPFLDSTLTLQSLAEQSNFTEKELSFLINKVEGTHFFNFINFHRIQEAKVLLQNKDLNIQQVMYSVGFNSKSSFNTAFKKHTSLTPSSYRKSIS